MDQLSFVDQLARDYKTRGENSRCWSDYLKAHGLANYCVALDPKDERHKLVYAIEKSWYQGNHPLTYNEHRDMTGRHKEALASYRRKVKDEFDNLQLKETSLSFSEVFSETNKSLLRDFTQDIFRVSEMCTDGFVGVTREIIEDSIAVLERGDMKAPCHFSVCALGSVAKGEVTPYSDLEYGFIVEHDDEYFTKLAVDTYFRVGNIGESPLSTFDIQELRESGPLADLKTVGFRIDGIKEKAGNIPTGRVGGQRLTLTVDGFMKLYKAEANAPFGGMAGDKSDMISSLSLVYSSQGSECPLYSGLKSAIARYEESLSNAEVDKKRLQSFSHDIEAYNYGPEESSTNTAAGVTVKVKPYIFRYPTLLANNIRVCLNLNSSFSWNIFTILKDREIISDDVHFYLTVAIALSIYIRTKVYMSLKSQSELVSLFTSSVPDDPHIYHLPQNLFLVLGYFTIPIKGCIRQSLQDSVEGVGLKDLVKSMVSKIVVDRDDFMLKFELLYFVENYRGAVAELSRVVGDDFDNFSCQSFVQILRTKYGPNKWRVEEGIYLEKVAWALRMTGFYATAVGYYDLCATFPTNVLHKATIKTYTGGCKKHLGHMTEAVTLLNESIQLMKQEAGSDPHDDILQHFKNKITSNQDISLTEILILDHLMFFHRSQSNVYRDPKFKNIELAKTELDNSIDAACMILSVHRRNEQTGVYPVVDVDSLPGSIDVGKCSTQELRCIHEIGCSTHHLGHLFSETDGELSLSYCQKALSFFRSVHKANTNHPPVASCIRSIGTAYESLRDLSNAQRYYREALQMYQTMSVNGSHLIDIANCYNDLGITHDKMGGFTIAVEFFREALNLRKMVPRADKNVADSYNNIGIALCRSKNYTEALECHKKALDMGKAVYGAESCSEPTIISHLKIGDVYYKMGDYVSSLSYYNKALEMSTA